ncbi:MAG TPA: oligosaccharide flippase family protein [Steroidobacteraceae bacterium]|nr:oligosaccharide flippase family protein [Steroidobacteraceae bacterium]
MSARRNFFALLRGGSGFAAVVQTGLATVLVLAINVVTGIVSARALGPQGRGELSALLLCPQFLSFLFALGLPSSTIVNIKRAPERASALMGTALVLSAVMGLVAAASGFVLMPRILRQYDASLIATARALLVFVMLGVTSTVAMAALQLRDRFVAYNRIRFWQSLLTLVALVALAVPGAFRPVTGALAYVLPTVPFFLWSLWWVLREFRPSLHNVAAQCRTLLSYGWRVHAVDTGNALFLQIDKIILVAVLMPAAFGIYVVVFNLSRLVTTFASSAVPVLLPRTAGRSAAEVLAATSRAFSAMSVLTLAAVMCFVLFGSIALRVVYGEQFASGYWVLVILSVEAALAGGAAVLQQPYLVLNRPGTIAVFQGLSLGLAVLLVYALGARFGLEGAAAGLLAGTCLRFVLTYCGFAWLLRVRPPRLMPTRAELASLLSRARASTA